MTAKYQTEMEIQDYIYSVQKFTEKHSLDHTRAFMEALGIDEKKFKIVHVAGTNGKGSTCNYLKALFRKQGLNVGMFISPHLVSMRERILYNEEMIPETDYIKAFHRVYELAQKEELYHPTFFEFLFLMAMVYYNEHRPDVLILETGLGGRLDTTNLFSKPAMTIITEIGLDHMQYLGDTKEKIAYEKAGIIKKGVPVVYAYRDQETAAVIENCAQKAGSLYYSVKKEAIPTRNIGNKCIDFSYFSRYYSYIDIILSTVGIYQAENASLALTAFEVMNEKPVLTVPQIQEAMKNANWAGRMEMIAEGVFLDGAHNEDGIKAFIETVLTMTVTGKRMLLFSVVDDKAYDKMAQSLIDSHLFTDIYIAGIKDTRGLGSMKIADLFEGREDIKCHTFESVKDAYQAAALAKEENDRLFVTGSLYLVGEVKAMLSRVLDN